MFRIYTCINIQMCYAVTVSVGLADVVLPAEDRDIIRPIQ